MAKKDKKQSEDLPFFKFFIQHWMVGNIQFCSHSSQGLFINLCVLYWAKKCELTFDQAMKSYPRKKKYLDELVSNGVVKISEGKVNISFLDEQLTVLKVESETNSENAKKRWNPTKSDATAMPNICEEDATAMPKEEEKKRIEEKRKEEEKTCVDGVEFKIDFTEEASKEPIVLKTKIPNSDAANFSDYEQWTEDVIKGNDALFEQMLMKEPIKVNGALTEYAKSYLKLLAEYPKKAPPDQHRFRVALIGHISESINKNYNGKRNNTKGSIGQNNPEPGKDYRAGGGF